MTMVCSWQGMHNDYRTLIGLESANVVEKYNEDGRGNDDDK